MGHEYIEMRNETAAIECYRKSIDLNCRDYRGCYGLGQTYELLQMYCYAIYYYNKVCKLRPYDYRMWMALGSCYQNLGNIGMSVKAYERAESIAVNNKANHAIEYKLCILQLAKLYGHVGKNEKSKRKYIKYCGFVPENRLLSDNEIEAMIKLAEYCLGDDDELETAAKYAQRIIKFGPKGKETAERILEQCRASMKNIAKYNNRNNKSMINSNDNRADMMIDSDITLCLS